MRSVLHASAYGVMFVVIAVGAMSFAVSADPLLDRAIESADSAADHAALAARYREMATEQADRARRHRALAQTYRKRGRMGPVQAPENHCKTLASLAESAAEEYNALASEHEKQSTE